jgi:hypothetical protein
MFLGQFKPAWKRPEEEEEERKERAPETKKSSDSETFLQTAKAKAFVKKWAGKKKDGKAIYTKRGVTALLKSVFQIPGLSSDEEVLFSSDELLSMLGGMDGLSGFLMGWKAKSEGLIKALKTVVGGK